MRGSVKSLGWLIVIVPFIARDGPLALIPNVDQDRIVVYANDPAIDNLVNVLAKVCAA